MKILTWDCEIDWLKKCQLMSTSVKVEQNIPSNFDENASYSPSNKLVKRAAKEKGISVARFGEKKLVYVSENL